ncbi:MAG: putative lipid II flippase FtsW [Lachnospiraceae bacterium]|nr:putative lipid II flippase FtsW [Lachnospiraceae bacterium]
MRDSDNRRQRNRATGYFDYSLLFIMFILLGFGLLMIFSASSYQSFNNFGTSTYYLKRQLLSIIIGVVLMVICAAVPYNKMLKLLPLLILASFVFVILVKVPGFKVERNNATRWIRLIPGSNLLVFQPVEIVKLMIILSMAKFMDFVGAGINKPKTWMGIGGFVGFFAMLILVLTNNLSSALIICAIAVAMFFVACPRFDIFVIGALACAAVAVIAVLVAVKAPPGSHFRFGRITAWLNPESSENGYQVLQGLYAIGSGGLWGKGLGQSMEKLSYLPEAQNDMIFSIICEELGIFGAIAVILLFVLLIWRMTIVAFMAPDLKGSLIVTGVLAHIAVQAVLNIAVVTNSIPNTGVSLPFISYGGTSVSFLMAEMGFVFGISMRSGGIRKRPRVQEGEAV